jgi:hypothetical protein
VSQIETWVQVKRCGYPARWDGAVSEQVLKVEHEMCRGVGPSTTALSLPPKWSVEGNHEELLCSVVLHIVKHTARELVPLELLNGLVDEDKVSDLLVAQPRVLPSTTSHVLWSGHLLCYLLSD